MTDGGSFDGTRTLTGGWEDALVLALLFGASVLAQVFLVQRNRHPENVHSPPLAWMRAGLYFSVVVLVSQALGVLPAVLHGPLAPPAQLHDAAWRGLTALCAAAVAWGYVIWWPRGTLTHGRRLYPVPAVLFGLVWGTCSALLTLCLWAVVEETGLPRWGVALAVLFLLSGYNQLYQSGWWDIHVSPPHNIRAWNAKKVLFGHLPFMAVTLLHFTLYGNAGLFVLFYAAALACSAVAMRFPPPWEQDGPPVSRETAIGE